VLERATRALRMELGKQLATVNKQREWLFLASVRLFSIFVSPSGALGVEGSRS
jgi:hypothetical protein